MRDSLNLAEVEANLRGVRLRGPLRYQEVTTSTNDEARSLGRSGAAEGTIIIAEEQTAGRGRHGRAWFGEKYRCLLFSVLLRPPLTAAAYPLLANAVGVAVAEAIGRTCACRAGTKWPNDIIIGGRKVGGLLVEADAPHYAVVGIGLNVLGRADDFPEEIRETAGTIAEEAGLEPRREAVLAEVMNQLDAYYGLLLEGRSDLIVARQRELETTTGRRVRATVGGRQVEGLAVGLADSGGLLLRTGEKEQVLTAGEVVLLGDNHPEGSS